MIDSTIWDEFNRWQVMLNSSEERVPLDSHRKISCWILFNMNNRNNGNANLYDGRVLFRGKENKNIIDLSRSSRDRLDLVTWNQTTFIWKTSCCHSLQLLIDGETKIFLEYYWVSLVELINFLMHHWIIDQEDRICVDLIICDKSFAFL